MAKMFRFEPTYPDQANDEIRGCVSEAFDVLVRVAQDSDLNNLVSALDILRDADPKLHRALLGGALTNDILQSIYDEHARRNPQAQQEGGAA